MTTISPSLLLEEVSRRQRARECLISFTEYTYPCYAPAPHHRLIADKLRGVLDGRIKRLMVFMPPRHGKSRLSTIQFPAWYLGRYPDRQIISASYNAELARDFGREVRNLVAGSDYRVLFPNVTLASDSSAADRWHTSKGGVYVAAGIGTAVTGRGADCLILDDVLKDRVEAESETTRKSIWDWYTAVAYTRLMPMASVVLVMTRWHHDDLAGRLLSAQEADGDRWDVVCLPAVNGQGQALWPERYPIEVLKQYEQVLGPRDWAALYQQQPTVEGGNIYRRKWWRAWPQDLPMPELNYLMQVWDTAYEDKEAGDYNACTIWGVFDDPFERQPRPAVILLGRYHKRRQFPELREDAYALYRKWDDGISGPVNQVLIEPKASGRSLIQELQRRGVPAMPWTVERGSRGRESGKTARAHAASTVLWAGAVYYPEGKRWADEVITQAEQFPAAPHDDLTDTVTTALLWLRRAQPVTFRGEPDDAWDRQDINDADEILAQRRRHDYAVAV